MDFDRLIDRRKTESVKWNYFNEDVLPMWVADMDFRSPEPVIAALQERVRHGVFGYGGPPDGLREAILQHLADYQQWTVAAQDISFVSGVVTGFTHAIYSLTEPGDRILIQTPVYPPFLTAPKSAGRECVHNKLVLCKDGKYEIDFDDFADKASSGVKMFILCNPHNPVGRVFTEEELLKMANICLEYGVLICSDEIHGDLVFSGQQHIPIANLSPDIAQITVTYLAPSKTFNIAGLSTSVCIAENQEIREQLAQSMSMLLGHPNILGLHAARSAYREGRTWLQDVLIYLEANRDYLVDFISRNLPGVKIWSPEATYLGWLNCRELDLGSSPHTFFLEEAKVGLNDGKAFGETGQGFVRLNFGCPRALLTEGLQRMKTALEKRC
jgi:cysteine-S-conjugate beta-lyase